MRTQHKMWRNDRGGRWSTRIIWLAEGGREEEEHTNIRLKLTDCEMEISLYPTSVEHARQIWFMFRQGSPTNGQRIPFIADLLRLLKKGGLIPNET